MADRSNQEAAVMRLFRQQADHLTIPPPDPHGVHARPTVAVADQGPVRGWNRLALLGATAAVAILVGVATIIWATPGTVTDMPAADSDAAAEIDYQFDFDTAVGVRLRASELTVDVGDRTFSPTGPDINVTGAPVWPPSPGELGHTTLELEWSEVGIEMLVSLHFAADDSHWWVTEIQTTDGADPAVAPIITTGEYLRTPLGQPFVGDLDAGPLHIGGMRLDAFVPRATVCDGSGAAGQLILELSGPRPVAGQTRQAGEAPVNGGYATTVEVLDASTCEPVEPDGVDFRVAVANTAIAVPELEVLEFGELGTEFGNLRVTVSFGRTVGETTLTVSAVDPGTGNVLATLDLPVTVTVDEDAPVPPTYPASSVEG